MANEAETLIRQNLKTAGYAPLPLTGKRPAMDQWSQKTDVNQDEIKLWGNLYPWSHNTGILTRITPAIDIDILRDDAASAIEALAREFFEERGHILVRFGKAPKRAILLRTDKPFKKIVTSLISPEGKTDQKIELLCDGQQVVVFGVHPDTHRPYTWHGGEPGEIRWEDLPYCSEDDARKFIIEAEQLLVKEFGFQVPAAPDRGGNGADTDVRQFHHADWSKLVSNIVAGIELHDSLRDLSASLIGNGISNDNCSRMLESLMLISSAPHDARWKDRYNEITGLIISAESKYKPQDQKPAIPLIFFPASVFEGRQVCEREWLVRQRIPMGNVTLLGGDGATGKTAIALQLAVEIVCPKKGWLNGDVCQTGGVLFYTAEEDEDEIHRRLAVIKDYNECTFTQLEKLQINCMPGQNSVLAKPDKSGEIKPTALFSRIELTIRATNPRLIVLESSADLFAGNEIDRPQVRQFISLLRSWSMINGAAVMLLSHPSLSGLGSGTGTSGSTAWNNSVRSRLYFSHKKGPSDESEDSRNDFRILEVKKSNYGPAGETVECVWKSPGVFIPIGQTNDPPEIKADKERNAEHAFMRCLDIRNSREMWVNQLEKSPYYAPRHFAKMTEANEGFKLAQFVHAMERLLDRGMIKLAPAPGRAPTKSLYVLVRSQPTLV